MFSSLLPPKSIISLAVLAALGSSAGAEALVEPFQTHFPGAGAVDVERRGAASIVSRIGADYAHTLGITGKQITIAVVDTGISTGHREFSEKGKLAPGFSVVSGGADVSDRAGHGTHVAGIIGAGRDGRGVFGVAYDASLLPVKVFPDIGKGSTGTLERGLSYVIGKARIVNMSVGSSNSYDPQRMKEAVGAGMLLVASAGNENAAAPTWPARFAREAWANNQIIAVGAVDSDNRIASFSNHAGDTAAWFLVAPGVNIVSTYLDDQYAYMSGTSMAAPMVSGAAALLMQRWPSLRADQVAAILLLTATDLGIPGIDPVYGRGLLNIERALQPIGAVTTTTYNGRSIEVLSGSIQPSAATSMLWYLAASGQLRVIGVDDFQRDFGIDLGATVIRPTAMTLDQAFGHPDTRMEVLEQVFGNDAEATFAFENGQMFAGTRHRRLAAFAMHLRSGSLHAMAGMGGQAARHFGIGDLRLGEDGMGFALDQVQALSNPYFNLVPAASHAGIAQQTGGFKLKFGLLTSGLSHALAAQYPDAPANRALPRGDSGVFELSRSFDDIAVSLSVSETRESHAWLGSRANGALTFGTRAKTSAVQLATAVLLMPKVALAGQVAFGMTPGGESSDSLITEVSSVKTNAFSLALVAADRFHEGDRLSLTLSQPMRAYSGRIVMDMTARSVSVRERLVFSMEPLGRELRAELNYRAPLGKNETLGMSFLLRHEPNNMVNVETDKLLAMHYAKRF